MQRRAVSLQVESLEERSLPSSAAPIGPVSPPVSDQMLAGVIPVLSSLDKSLKMDFHDYDGHKWAAIKDIDLAEQELVTALNHVDADKFISPPTSSTPHPPTTQAASNAQLTADIGVLQAEIKTLEASDKGYGGHKAKAIQDLIDAVTQLNEAVLYSSKHDKSVT